MLKFAIGDDSDPPDFEAPRGTGAVSATNTNTYKVVVVASDAETGGMMGYHKVTVMVTNEDEEGEVTWTVDPDGGDTHTATTPKLTQFQVGASLMTSATDGDIAGTTKAVADAHDDVAADPTWRWYRSPSKTSMGTMIDGETSITYTVTTADVGMYLRVVAYYLITGNVDQESASLTSDYPVLAVRAGNNTLKFSQATVSREVSEGKKGMNVGAPVTATGNHGAVNYTLVTGVTIDDDGKFKIDQKTGQITTDMDLDYDTVDADNCRDADFCTVTVRATDASGDATAETVATNVFVDATVTIKVTDVNEKPTFSTGDDSDPRAIKAIEMPENNTVLSTSGDIDENDVTYMAADPEDRSLTYRLMGSDGAKFELSNSQVLSFEAKPDYEKPTDRNKDNVYEVTVRASDGTMHADRMVEVTVTPVNDAPEIMGKDSVNYAENGKDPVDTFTATDPEGVTPITWSLATTAQVGDAADLVETDNADAEHFMIDDKDGMLKFDIEAAEEGSSPGSPDFENAQDEGEDNTYNVVVAASDGTQTGLHKVTVKVTKVTEKGK